MCIEAGCISELHAAPVAWILLLYGMDASFMLFKGFLTIHPDTAQVTLIDTVYTFPVSVEGGSSVKCLTALLALIGTMHTLPVSVEGGSSVECLTALLTLIGTMYTLPVSVERIRSVECPTALLARIEDYLFRLNTAACIDLSPAIATAFIQHNCRHNHAGYTDTGHI